MTNEGPSYRFSGKVFTPTDVALIREVVETCAGVSRKELANTVSELLGWTRPGGALKEPECLAVLERLEATGLLALPEKQKTRPWSAGCESGRRRPAPSSMTDSPPASTGSRSPASSAMWSWRRM